MNTTKIIEEISIEEFKEIIYRYNGNVIISPHALDHLSEEQRKIFKEDELKNILLKENPRGIGKQKNGRFAVFFRRSERYIKIIFELKNINIEIITFMNIDTLPNLKRL